MDHTRQVPVELLTNILDFLPQPDVLNVAAVSMRLKTVAQSHSSFYRHVQFGHEGWFVPEDVNHISLSGLKSSVRHFKQRMTAAQKGGARISLVVKFPYNSGDLNESSLDLNDPDDDGSRFSTREIELEVDLLLAVQVMPVLQDSLPQTVSITLHLALHAHAFLAALCRAPAPRLRTFECWAGGYRHGIQTVPEGLFRLVAPNLDVVDLGTFLALPSRSVPVFLRARRVRLAIRTSDFSQVVAQFPNMRHLECFVSSFEDLSSLNSTESIAAILVLGRQLHSLKLAVHDLFRTESCQVSPALNSLLDACSNIASVDVVVRQRHTRYIPCIRPVLHSLGAPITLVLHDILSQQPGQELDADYLDVSRYRRIGMRVASRTSGRSLTGHFEHLSLRWVLGEISVLHTAITELDVWYWHIRPVLCGLEILAGYPCIQRLRIDLSDGVYNDEDEGETLRDLLDEYDAEMHNDPEETLENEIAESAYQEDGSNVYDEHKSQSGDANSAGDSPASSDSDSTAGAVTGAGDDATSDEYDDDRGIPPPASPWPALQHLTVYASGAEVAVSVADLVTLVSMLLLAGPRSPSQKPVFHASKGVVVEGDDLQPLHDLFSTVIVDNLNNA